MKTSKKKTKKFLLFVKKLDERGEIIYSQCGFLSFNKEKNTHCIGNSFSDAIIFEEKKDGQGSFKDWKKFFEEEHDNWLISDPPVYI